MNLTGNRVGLEGNAGRDNPTPAGAIGIRVMPNQYNYLASQLTLPHATYKATSIIIATDMHARTWLELIANN